MKMEVDGIHHSNNVHFKSFAIKGFLFLLQTNQFTQNEFPDSHEKNYTFLVFLVTLLYYPTIIEMRI